MFRIVILIAFASLLPAQVSAPRRIQAVGTASITIQPDMVKINVGVSTSATTAAEAAAQNATAADKMISAVRALVGGKGSIKTVSYSIRPDTRTVGQQQQIVGYTATNTIEVSAFDTGLVGRIIDTAVQAGANSIGSPMFTLQSPAPVLQQALSAAAKQARSDADAIAAGLGGRTGQVISAQEGATYTPLDRGLAVGATATTTPIQPGTLEISATVTILVELL